MRKITVQPRFKNCSILTDKQGNLLKTVLKDTLKRLPRELLLTSAAVMSVNNSDDEVERGEYAFYTDMITDNWYNSYSNIKMIQLMANTFFSESLKLDFQHIISINDPTSIFSYNPFIAYNDERMHNDIGIVTITNNERFNSDLTKFIMQCNKSFDFMIDCYNIWIKEYIKEYANRLISVISDRYNFDDLKLISMSGALYNAYPRYSDVISVNCLERIQRSIKSRSSSYNAQILWLLSACKNACNISRYATGAKTANYTNVYDRFIDSIANLINPENYIGYYADVIEINTNHGYYMIFTKANKKEQISLIPASSRTNATKYYFDFEEKVIYDSKFDKDNNPKDHDYGVGYYGGLESFLVELIFISNKSDARKFNKAFEYNAITDEFKALPKIEHVSLLGNTFKCLR